jgi:uncharacterized cofD-like protein
LLKRESRSAAAASTHPLRIVSIGGGTGLSTLLRGLKRYVPAREGAASHAAAPLTPEVEITAIVTVSDDGGSSGRLRRDFAVLPPGDIRNCMVALSEDEALLSRLFQYRFSNGRGLKGHSFGNLFLTAMNDLTGDFAQAVKLSSEVLASAGRIFPATATNVVLEARLSNQRTVVGESRISRSKSRIESISLRPRGCRPLKEALQAIAQADLITLGPGSLYTSIIPNLLVRGVPEAIAASPAVKAYFVNLMWQPGETTGFTASEHVKSIFRHAGRSMLDYVVVNTSKIRPALLRKYQEQRSQPVVNDIEELRTIGVEVIGAPLACEKHKVRHDSDASAAIAVQLAARARKRKH